MRVKSLVILISGRGSNAGAIADAVAAGTLCMPIRAAIADRSAAGLDDMAARGIDTACLPARRFTTREAFEQRLHETIAGFDPDLVVLAGFMRVLSAGFVQRWRGRMVNIHPSLLPRYRGLDTHRRVLEAGDREHGASVHFVTPELDAGPVLTQARIAVEPEDRPESLERRLLPTEHRLYPATLALLAQNSVEYSHNGHDEIHLNDKRLHEPLVLDRDFDDRGRLRRG